MKSPLVSRLFHWTVVALLALATIELAFRLVLFPSWKALQQDMHVAHPVFDFYTRPNLDVRRLKPGNWDVRVTTNALGLRGRPDEMAADLAGLWFVGDSNTFGGYLDDDDVFVARLAKAGLRSANLANEGHDMVQQARVLRWLIGQDKRPRAVMAVVSLYHGVRPYQDAPAALARPATAFAAQPKPRPHAVELLRGGVERLGQLPASGQELRALLGGTSATYGWLKSGIMGVPGLRDLTLRLGLRTDLDLVYPFELDLLRPMAEGNPALAEIRATADLLAAMAELVTRELGVPFGVLVLPGNHQVYPAAFARWQASAGRSGEDLDPLRVMHAIEAEVAARGLPVLDVLAPLRAAPVRVIFPDDGHLNAEGHRIVAEALAGWLPKALGTEPRP
jgi:hypothetical protein